MILRPLRRGLLAALTVSLLATGVRAQALDDVWFKVTLNLKGDAFTPTDEVEKVKGKVVLYMHVTAADLDSAGAEGDLSLQTYELDVVSETAPFTWETTSSSLFHTAGAGERAMIGTELSPASTGIPITAVIPDEDATELEVRFVARLKLKFDKNEMLKSASFVSTGALVPFGVGGEDLLLGGARLKGKRVPVSKLPFEVEETMET